MTAVMTVTNNQSIREKPWTFCPVVMQIMHNAHIDNTLIIINYNKWVSIV